MRAAWAAAFLALHPFAAAAQAVEDAQMPAAVLALVDSHCMPWVADAQLPDAAGLVRVDPDNPDHQAWGEVPKDSFLLHDGRTLLTWSQDDSGRFCGMTFFEADAQGLPTPLANSVAQETAAWARALGRGPDWAPMFTCVQLGFGVFLSYNRVVPLAEGKTVQILVSAGGSHKDPESWGAFATISLSQADIGDPICLGEEG